MFRIPSQCNINSSEINFSPSEKKRLKATTIGVNSKLGFTPAVMPSNFMDFSTKSSSSESASSQILSSTKMPTNSSSRSRSIQNTPEYLKTSFITQCPPGYSSIGGLNVGSKYLNCVHNLTRKQIQILCPPNYSINKSGKCTINKNNKPHDAPKSAKPEIKTYENTYKYKETYMVPGIYKDFPKNAHNSFRSSRKIIIED